MYYLRTKAATDAIKFTVEKNAVQAQSETEAPVENTEVENSTEKVSK